MISSVSKIVVNMITCQKKKITVLIPVLVRTSRRKINQVYFHHAHNACFSFHSPRPQCGVGWFNYFSPTVTEISSREGVNNIASLGASRLIAISYPVVVNRLLKIYWMSSFNYSLILSNFFFFLMQ